MDNASPIALTRGSGDRVFTALVAELRRKGFVPRDEVVGSQNLEFLGVVLDGTWGRWRHTGPPLLAWYALVKVLQMRCTTGVALRVLGETSVTTSVSFPR